MSRVHQEPGELEFYEGNELTILERDDDTWWTAGRFTDQLALIAVRTGRWKTGRIPATAVKLRTVMVTALFCIITSFLNVCMHSRIQYNRRQRTC